MYYVRVYNDSDYIYLFRHVDCVFICVKYFIGFKGLYDYLVENQISFDNVIFKKISLFDIFEHFIDESSLNPNVCKGGRL